jgi:PAS domain S-box-containing protein
MLPALNIKSRLILLLVIVGLIPLTVVSLVMLDRAHTALSHQAFSQLENISQSKKTQLERHFARIRADITVLAGSTHIGDALDAFASVLDNGELDKLQYDYFESLEYGGSFRKFLKEYGYYDLMLITREGEIVYSTRREADLTQNIRTGPLAQSQLGQAFNSGLAQVTVTDFDLYAPSGQQAIAFLIAPVAHEEEETLGAVVLKMTHQQINDIMLERSGMGRTGEAYLVGPDLTMRSDAYLDPINRSMLASLRNPQQGRVETEGSRRALAGETGEAIQDDYRGVPVLSAYAPVQWGAVTYALIAEMEESEAFAAITELRRLMVFTGIVLVVLIVLAALFIATVITKPILSLTAASIKIAEGNLVQEVSVKRHDELGVLADNFNRMRLSIAEKIGLIERQKQELNLINEGLEDLVAKRTAALAETQERFELAMKAGDLGLWDWQLKTGELFVNDGWAEMIGHSKDEISNSIDEWSNRLHPDDTDVTMTAFNDYVDGRTVFYQPEFRLRAKDGGYRWILSIGKAIERDEQGAPLRMIGIHMDITERRRMADELSKSKEEADAANQAKSAFLAPTCWRSLTMSSICPRLNPARWKPLLKRSIWTG